MTKSASMYEQVMGSDFASLDMAVQRFHRLAGFHRLYGWVETSAPQSMFAKLLAIGLGTPLRASQGKIQFELNAEQQRETWIRFFPSKVMRSRLRRREGGIVESLGVARLTFQLCASEGRLVMHLRELHILGIRCPAWIAPHVVAEETGVGDQLHFHIEAAVPFAGVVASYRGHLVVPEEES